MSKQNSAPLPFDPFGGMAPESRPPETVSADFWKPAIPGESVYGIIESFGAGKIGNDETRRINLRPATVLVPSDDASTPHAATARQFHSLRVGLNTVLAAKLNESEHNGKPVLIQYSGDEPTPQGKMRVYKVWILTMAQAMDLEKKYAGAAA